MDRRSSVLKSSMNGRPRCVMEVVYMGIGISGYGRYWGGED